MKNIIITIFIVLVLSALLDIPIGGIIMMGVIAVAIVVIIIVSSQHSLAVPPEIKKEQEDHHRQIGLRSSGFQSAVNEEPDESFVFIIKDEDEKPVKTTTNENVQRPEKNSAAEPAKVVPEPEKYHIPIQVTVQSYWHGEGVDDPDDSIEEISGHSYKLVDRDKELSLTPYPGKVPYWPHTYIYSTRELHHAGASVKAFYEEFKKAFLNGVYYNTEENSNYSFTLFFDLLDGYDKHRNLTRLENQLHVLGICYPKTAPYAERELITRAKKRDRKQFATEDDPLTLSQLVSYYPESFQWRFSDKYGEKLELTNEEADVLDFINGKYGSYSYVEVIRLKEVALFRSVIQALEQIYQQQNTTVRKVFEKTARSFKLPHPANSYYAAENRMADTEQKIFEIYNVIFRIGKKLLNQQYKIKGEVDPFNSLEHSSGKRQLEQDILPVVEPVIQEELKKLPPFSVAEEQLVNRSYTTRWKEYHEEIKDRCGEDLDCYLKETEELVKRNATNPGIRLLLFDLAKLLSPGDPTGALKMYLRYIRVCREHPECILKPLPKYIAKKIFKTEGSEERFGQLLEQYKKDGNWENAWANVATVLMPPRKTLGLDREAIRKAETLHSGTVELLNQVLTDEHPEEVPVVVTGLLPEQSEGPVIPGLQPPEPMAETGSHPLLDETQVKLLRLFEENNLSLPVKELDVFARSAGVFAAPFVEKINDIYYEVLDDLLIEEEEDAWTISEEYFDVIIAYENKH